MIELQSFKPEYSLTKFIRSYGIINGKEKSTNYKRTILPYNEACLAFLITKNKKNDVYNKSTTGIYICPASAKPHNMNILDDFFYVDVSFYPGVLHELFNIPFDKLENRAYSIEELSIRIDKNILESLYNKAEDIDDILSILNSYFFKLFYNFHESYFLSNIKDLYLNCKLDEFYTNTKLSVRQVQRNINRYTGLNARTIQRISRFYKILDLINKQNNDNMAIVSKDLEFYDQSHLLKEFKLFTGSSFKDFKNNSSQYLNF